MKNKKIGKPVLWLGDMKLIDEALLFIQRDKPMIAGYKYEMTRQKILQFRDLGITCLGEEKLD